MSTYLIPIAGNIVLALAGIAICVRLMRRQGRLLILPLSLVAFLATNALFLFVPLVVNLDVRFPVAPVVFERAAVAHLILVLIVALPLTALFVIRANNEPARYTSVPLAVPVSLLVVSCLAMGFFEMRNPDVLSLALRIYRAADYYEYIDTRNQVGFYVDRQAFSGIGLANLAFAFICPCTMASCVLCKDASKPLLFSIASVSWVLMAYFAVVVGSREMLLFIFVMPALVIFQKALQMGYFRRSLRSFSRIAGLLALMACIGIAVFQMALHASATDSLRLLFTRTLVVPGAVSGCYYVSFPDFFQFRGLHAIFAMPVPTDLVDFNMISLATTGIPSNANASFLATAYSGFGMPGVALVALAVALGAFAVDVVLLQLPPLLCTSIVLASAYAVLNLGSLPLRTATVSYGYLIGPAVLATILVASRGPGPNSFFRKGIRRK